MKKIICLVCIFLTVVLLTACSTVYVPQENINLNYNNLSAGDFYYWLENDYAIYSDSNHDHDCELKYFMKTKDENTLLSQQPTASWEAVQVYGSYIYYSVAADENEENYDAADIYRYDTAAKTETYIATASYFSNFFVDASYLYLVNSQEYFNGTCFRTDVISLETKETVTQISDIYTCGMRDGNFTYLKDTQEGFEIFEYLPKTNKSQKIGTVTLPVTTNINIHETVNFTSQNMILEAAFTESDVSQILIYNFNDGTLKTIDTPYFLCEIIAYDNHAFCMLDDWDSNKYYLYSLNLETYQLLQLGRIGGDKSLFVTSDEDVYLCGWDEIVRYNLDDTKEQVLVKTEK